VGITQLESAAFRCRAGYEYTISALLLRPTVLRFRRAAPLPLKVTAIVLTQAERTLLSQLAQEQKAAAEAATRMSLP